MTERKMDRDKEEKRGRQEERYRKEEGARGQREGGRETDRQSMGDGE